MSAESPVCLTVEIPLAGDGFPDAKELKARNAITDRLDKRRIGRFQGAGGGMGAMDFSYVVTDEARARQEIESALAAILPDVEYSIERDDAELDDDDDDGEGGSVNWVAVLGLLLVVAILGIGFAWLVWSIVT